MKPLTSVKVPLLKGVFEVRLGDVFLPTSKNSLPHGRPGFSDIANEFVSIAILSAGLTIKHIHFIVLCVDSSKYIVSRYNKNSVSLLSTKGKQIEFTDSRILEIFRNNFRRRNSDIVDGTPMYIRDVITRTEVLAGKDARKAKERIIDISQWPNKAISAWVKTHLNLDFDYQVLAEPARDKMKTINTIIKARATKFRQEEDASRVKSESRSIRKVAIDLLEAERRIRTDIIGPQSMLNDGAAIEIINIDPEDDNICI